MRPLAVLILLVANAAGDTGRPDASCQIEWTNGFADASGRSTPLLVGHPEGGAVLAYTTTWAAIDAGGGPVAPSGRTSGLLVRYDSKGHHVFSRRIGNDRVVELDHLAVSADGSVWLGGTSRGPVDLGRVLDAESGRRPEADQRGVFVTKLDAAGQPVFTFQTAANANKARVFPGPDGSFLFAASFSDELELCGRHLRSTNGSRSQGDRAVFVSSTQGPTTALARFDRLGRCRWVKTLEGVADGLYVGFDPNGDVVIGASPVAPNDYGAGLATPWSGPAYLARGKRIFGYGGERTGQSGVLAAWSVDGKLGWLRHLKAQPIGALAVGADGAVAIAGPKRELYRDGTLVHAGAPDESLVTLLERGGAVRWQRTVAAPSAQHLSLDASSKVLLLAAARPPTAATTPFIAVDLGTDDGHVIRARHGRCEGTLTFTFGDSDDAWGVRTSELGPAGREGSRVEVRGLQLSRSLSP